MYTHVHTHRHTYKYYNIPHANYIYTHYNTYTHIPHTNNPPHNTNTQACTIYTTLQTHKETTQYVHIYTTHNHTNTLHIHTHIYTQKIEEIQSVCIILSSLFFVCFLCFFFGYCLSESWFCFPMQIVLIQPPLQSDYRHVSPCLMVLYYFDNFFLYFFSMFISV